MIGSIDKEIKPTRVKEPWVKNPGTRGRLLDWSRDLSVWCLYALPMYVSKNVCECEWLLVLCVSVWGVPRFSPNGCWNRHK